MQDVDLFSCTIFKRMVTSRSDVFIERILQPRRIFLFLSSCPHACGSMLDLV